MQRKNKVSRAAWFTAVKECTNHWDRVNERCLVLYFPGYKMEDYYVAQNKLMDIGGTFLKVDYDQQCGKTVVLVQEPKHFREGA